MSENVKLYRPQTMGGEYLEATLVARERFVTDILESLGKWTPGGTRQHFLIIGPRGIGKTTILAVLNHRIIHGPEHGKKWFPVMLAEESYGITSVADILIETLGYVGSQSGDAHVSAVYERVRHDDSENAIDLTLDELRRFYKTRKTGVLIMIENVNRVFGKQLRRHDDLLFLRKIMQEEDWLVLLCTSPTYLDAVTDPQEPLFESCKVIVLPELTAAEQGDLIKRRWTVENRDPNDVKLRLLGSRIHTLYHFTGGNPRLANMLYDLVVKYDILQVKTELEMLLDNITPFYQNRMNELSAQEAKIIEKMALIPEGCTPSELAIEIRMPRNTVSALLSRLEFGGYVRSEPRRNKRTIYIIKERFFRIWHQITHSRVDRGRLQFLLEFFSTWYATKEERDEVWTELLAKFERNVETGREVDDNDTVEYMDYIADISEGDEQVKRRFEPLLIKARHRGIVAVQDQLAKLDDEYAANAVYFAEKGLFLAGLDNDDLALAAFQEAYRLRKSDMSALVNQAIALERLGRRQEARRVSVSAVGILAQNLRIPPPLDVPRVLIAALETSGNFQVLWMTVTILGIIGNKEYAEDIIRIMHSAVWAVRRQYCATALGLMAAGSAVDGLIDHLGDPAGNVRGSAATALGRIGSEKAVEPLIQCLQDDTHAVRGSASTALGRVRSEKAVEPLIQRLQDEAGDVRGSAATALGRIGSEMAVGPLIQCLQDEARDVRGSAATALGRIGSEKTVEPLIQCLHDEASDVRGSAATALGRIGSEKAVEPLIQCLHDEDRYNRGSAATALGRIGSKKAVEPLIQCLRDEDSYVRASAATASGHINSENAVEPLIQCLQDEDDIVRSSAAIALGRISNLTAIPRIAEIMETLIGEMAADAPVILHKIVNDLMRSAFRSRDLHSVGKALAVLESKLPDGAELCVPYTSALKYLNEGRNPAILERHNLEMRDAVLMVVACYDEGFVAKMPQDSAK